MRQFPWDGQGREFLGTGAESPNPAGNSTMVQGEGGVKFRNWAGTYGSDPELYFRPGSVEELREILDLARQRGKRVKVVGGGHSPSDIACSQDFMIHMGKMNRVLQVDRERLQVTVEAGILLSELNRELDKHGMALANQGAVSEVTAAGVIGTGTHNTGIGHGILPTQVAALSLLLASGEILECSDSAHPEVFRAARLHLGCLGIVLSVTFRCVPEFRLREVAFPSTLPQVLDQLEEHLRRSQYFRFLWFPHSDNVRIIYQDPTSKPPRSSSSWFWDYAVGYYLLEFLLWISSFVPALVPWISRAFFWLLFSSRAESVAPSHRAFTYECRFRQHVQDWAIPMPYGKDVPRLDYWLTYEGIMRRHGGRPHWAKAHSCTRKDLEEMYPAFPEFCAVREKLDPTGIFLNAYLEKVFF